jgi:histidyl-tRNA synthetase
MFEEIYNALKDFKVKNEDANKILEILETSDLNKIKNHVKNNETAKKELQNLEKITKILENSFNIKKYQIKISIVRGLDYYKGIVFEIEAPILGAEKQLCGGGAYELVSLFEGKDTPTAGFAIGFDRTILALESEKYKFPKQKLNFYIIPIKEDIILKALELAQTLREQNFSVDLDLMRRGLSKSLKYASSIKAEKVIIVGPKELEKKEVTIRDMKTGKQRTIAIEDLSKI